MKVAPMAAAIKARLVLIASGRSDSADESQLTKAATMQEDTTATFHFSVISIPSG
jgi:hypothetical protein